MNVEIYCFFETFIVHCVYDCINSVFGNTNTATSAFVNEYLKNHIKTLNIRYCIDS